MVDYSFLKGKEIKLWDSEGYFHQGIVLDGGEGEIVLDDRRKGISVFTKIKNVEEVRDGR